MERQLQDVSTAALGYECPVAIKPPELPPGWTRPTPMAREEAECGVDSLPTLGVIPHDPANAPQPWPWPPLPPGLWPDHCTDGPEQYDAYESHDIRADPVLRIHLRHMAMEGVRGHHGIVTSDGVSVRVDAAERTVSRFPVSSLTEKRPWNA